MKRIPMKKLLVLIVLTWLAITLEAQAKGKETIRIDTATFFTTCPTVEVTSETVVEGTAKVIGNCHVTISENVKLTLASVNLVMGNLRVDGGPGSELTIKNSIIHASYQGLYFSRIEGPSVTIENSVLHESILISSSYANAPITLKSSQLQHCGIIYSFGPDSPILLKESRIDGCADDTIIGSYEDRSPITLSGGTLINSGELTQIFSYGDDSPITINDSTVATSDGTMISSQGADGPITITGTNMLSRFGPVSVGSQSIHSAVMVKDSTIGKAPSFSYPQLGIYIFSHAADSPVTVSGTAITLTEWQRFSMISSSGDDSPVTVKNCEITADDKSEGASPKIYSYGNHAPLKVVGSVFAGDLDLSIVSMTRTKAVENDFTNMEGSIIITGTIDCISKDNIPNIPCN